MLGVVANSNAEYHSGPGTSVSHLKVLVERTPSHLHLALSNPTPPTASMRLGTALHCWVLERPEFHKRFAICPAEISLNSKIGRELVAEAAAEGREVLSAEDAIKVEAMGRKLLERPPVKGLLAFPHECETSLYWRDAATGVLCRARPDLMIEPCEQFPNGLILDLKTCVDASANAFSKAADKLGYHMQAAWYSDGFQKLYGTALPPLFVFAAVENEPPFEAKLWPASDGQIRLGRAQCRRTLEIYAECERTGVWPGYPEDMAPLPLTPWGINKLKQLEGNDG